MSTVSLDFETFSFAEIKDAGTVRYCSDPTTDVLCLAMAVDDAPPLLWLPPHLAPIWGRDQREAEQLLASLPDSEEIHAFNALFEITIFKHKFPDLKIPDRLWRCSQALARRSGYPDSLAKAAEVSGGQAKDAEGGRLIRKFCIPINAGKRKGERRMPEEDVEDFDLLLDYCVTDVVAERELYEKCKPFEFKKHVLEAAHDDLVLNMAGIPINVPAVERAIELRADATKASALRFEEVTGCRPSQRADCLSYFQDQGYGYKSLDETHVIRELETDKSMTPEGREMMELRYHIAGSAHAKLDKMLAMVCTDGTVKGGHKFMGAAQTGRWSGAGLQIQNFKKPGQDMDTAGFFQMIQAGNTLEEIEMVHGPYVPNLCGAIRHFVQGPFIGCDYASIEARILAWIAGQEDLVQAFRNGADIYKDMASTIFNKPASEIKKPSPERDLGKSVILGCGFGLGHAKFFAMNEDTLVVPGITEESAVVFSGGRYRYGEIVAPTRETLEKRVVLAQRKVLAEKSVDAYRAKNDKIANYSRDGRWQLGLWGHVEATAIKAMREHGEWHTVPQTRGRIAYQYREVRGRRYLLCRLPSGRCLCYMDAKLSMEMTSWGKEKEGISYYAKSQWSYYQWKRVYGGLLVENCLAQGTIVRTLNGFVPIESVTTADKVWDGNAFVTCDGAVCQGSQGTIRRFGFEATPDHEFMVNGSWKEWQTLCHDQLKTTPSRHRLEGKELRRFNRDQLRREQRQENAVGLCMQMWQKLRKKLLGSKPATSEAELSQSTVYDILNCGPRHRFAVYNPQGEELIAHNCVQAIAADVMMVGLHNLLKAGYDVRFLVHDEAVAIDNGQDPREMERIMCDMPEWGSKLPLAAEAERLPYYSK